MESRKGGCDVVEIVEVVLDGLAHDVRARALELVGGGVEGCDEVVR